MVSAHFYKKFKNFKLLPDISLIAATFRLYSWKKLCSYIFKAYLVEVTVTFSEKAKYVKEDVWKDFFR